MTAKKSKAGKVKKVGYTGKMKDNVIATQRTEILRLKGLLANTEWKDANTYPLSKSCIPEGCLVSILDADKPLAAGDNPDDTTDIPALNYKYTHWRIIAKPPGYGNTEVTINAEKMISDICEGDERLLTTHKEVAKEIRDWIKRHSTPAKK